MHGSFRRIVDLLTRSLDLRLVCVHCVDVQLCSDENNYMAAVLLCLNIMLNLELSHVNVSQSPATNYSPFCISAIYTYWCLCLFHSIHHRSGPRRTHCSAWVGMRGGSPSTATVTWSGFSLRARTTPRRQP